MSWIEQELKRRTAKARPAVTELPSRSSEPERMQDLWTRFQDANAALPSELQLQHDSSRPAMPLLEEANIREWLRSPSGAALGFTGNAVRYIWPERSQKRSNNFWIRWNAAKQAYAVHRRVNASMPPAIAEYRFDDRKIEHMVKCLVMGRRIKPRSVRKKRFGLF